MNEEKIKYSQKEFQGLAFLFCGLGFLLSCLIELFFGNFFTIGIRIGAGITIMILGFIYFLYKLLEKQNEG